MGTEIRKFFFLLCLLIHPHCRAEIEEEENDESHLVRYLEALDEVVEFSYKFRNNIFINLGLGLFLAKVNLKLAVENSEGLPGYILSSMLRLNYELDKTLKYFNKHQVPEIIRRDQIQENITSLLNETMWVRRLRNYENKILMKTLGNAPVPEVIPWYDYMRSINEGPVVPDQYQSVVCMAAVGENPINTGRRMTRCRIREECYGIILNGTSDGYALTHRLLIILVGHFGRNCYVFSRNQDETLIQDMCALALKEAQYIAEKGFLIRDLMMEQISLCTLNGYSEFVQHVWMSKFLELQSTTGCFAEEVNGDCKEHATAAAASSLAAAIRFWSQELF